MSRGDHKVSKITSEAIFAVRPITSTSFLISLLLCLSLLLVDIKYKVSDEVRGRNLAEGTPVTFTMESKQIYDAMLEPLSSIVQAIRSALEQSPPELSADISERGIVLTGGGAILRDIEVLISSQTGVPVIVAEDPLTCVARGGGRALEIMDKYDIDLLSTE